MPGANLRGRTCRTERLYLRRTPYGLFACRNESVDILIVQCQSCWYALQSLSNGGIGHVGE